MINKRWMINDMTTLVTGGFSKVEVTFVVRGILDEVVDTFRINDDFQDVYDDEQKVEDH